MTVSKISEFIFFMTLVMALIIFLFPLIISIITQNYYYFFLFAVSWIPTIIIAKIGASLFD